MKLREYATHDATGLAELVNRREISAIELVQLAREAHNRMNPTINAVVEFYDDAESVRGADTGPFTGVPFLRKDLGPTEAGRLQECGSQLFVGYRPTVDSYFIQRARAAGLRILGRTTTPELGIGSSESALCGVTRNPWNLERTSGGSTAGSAAAVAAGIVPIASGGDGGGSIRVPASFCGLVGLNPSRGRVSGGPNQQDGGLSRSRTFLMCRTVRDMAAALDVFSGAYPGDPFVIAPPERSYVEELHRPTGSLRVGVAMSSWVEGQVGPGVLEAVINTAQHLEAMGHRIEEMPPPYHPALYPEVAAAMYHMGLLTLDATARELGRKIDEHTLEPVNLKLYRKSKQRPLTYAGEVFQRDRKFRADVGEAIKDYDILVTPTMPCTAFRHGTYSTLDENLTVEDFLHGADLAMHQYMHIFNVTGHPSVSLPLFQSLDGLPIGVQIVGRFGEEATLVRIARDLEEAIPWAARRPPVFAGECE
ncbi:MAG: amidase [Mesorhizobium sp.]|uniref:amidase n=1 Tax=unclassified Mesorhizobium TaxID=325217 RepID=UPI000F74C7AC|nr:MULTISPECIES: amidase [unclassified Mesorhizobium]AZO50288.1 amidase [Mesorhizobium sp. M4B.F.Ca.ET.058.02.1.1]RWD32123.1 MAG: amidase [Mesorhizobium sp.]TIW11036.1 MAG: amidase [Mesorhizobium sp.]TIW36685.1 MAG: amidase [Mesorhizobium sp.]